MKGRQARMGEVGVMPESGGRDEGRMSRGARSEPAASLSRALSDQKRKKCLWSRPMCALLR